MNILSFDENSFDEIFRQYQSMVFRLAYANLRSKSDADDVFQEVFLRYIQKKPQFDNEEHQKAWFIRVTINCCRKVTASAWFKRTVPIGEQELPYELQEEWDLENALRKLPAVYRTVIHLFYYEDLPTEKIASILKRKPSTIRTQLTRGRKLLKKELKGELNNENTLQCNARQAESVGERN